VNHRKGYASPEEAMRSKAYLAHPGAVLDLGCRCGKVHVRQPGEPPAGRDARKTAKRRGTGAGGAVARILAGEITVAQGARDTGCDPDYLEDLAWKAAKAAALLRDGYRCLYSGHPADDVQHRVARGMGGTADPVIAFGLVNLVSMCRPCHRVAESRDMGMYEMGYWRWQGENPALVPVMIFSEHGSGMTVWLTPDGAYSTRAPGEAAA
jgi:hypothetical protein